eukprot:CAMPEP_0179171428 /NCGR_PEP_ID=MMETSP0796-20121207/84504_1 /TAXON_ID=73915 /ORGANISM="Pyrodinium bahamense, Strain pbaha01" /LENGTH=50 /DNA_ID=CAMNT_0020874497 /DNA_START=33 /DNA_END=181 /DNA_ORIENTATION=-
MSTVDPEALACEHPGGIPTASAASALGPAPTLLVVTLNEGRTRIGAACLL